MDASAFVEKWRLSKRSEKSAAQEHFLDLCDVFGHPKPGEVDSKGLTFTAEKRVKKAGGGKGFADFYKKDFFAWEYKRRGADLNSAFNQLLQYSGDLGNPPLLVASDMDRIEIRTHFTGFPTQIHTIALENFTRPDKIRLLRQVFFDPEALRPEKTIERITEDAARQLAEITPRIREQHKDAAKVAHFLDRLIFCLFAEDVGLLPAKLFSQVVSKYDKRDSGKIIKDIGQLFEAMSSGGDFFGEVIPHFDGNLFDTSPTLELNALELQVIHEAAALDWSQMDPSIFGTLFERVMDPSQRAALGAHYTGYTDIATLVEPVVMVPLRREWEACRARVESVLSPATESEGQAGDLAPADEMQRLQAKTHVEQFLSRLRSVKVLDPACGSGNFLYVTLRMLKDLEYEVLVFCRHHHLATFDLKVGPQQLHGIEKNPYAFDLAQMTVWIGFIQWHFANGFPYKTEPVLQPLQNFDNKDAIMDLRVSDHPAEPAWPESEFVVGNPPFLGGKKMRTELGDEYVDALFDLWKGRVRPEADLCCYWFEKARNEIEAGRCKRVGLLATQGIRGGASREALKRVKQTGDIFFAESDRPWVLDGANVHVSMVGFDSGLETVKILDQRPVSTINSNLTGDSDVTQAKRLRENLDIAFMGDTKGGSFDIIERQAVGMLDRPNPNGRPNSDVIVPWINGLDITRRNRSAWIIDFGTGVSIAEASTYERPFEYVRKEVYPARLKNKRDAYREKWWLHVEPRPAMRERLLGLPRFLVTATVSKHRLFSWIEAPTLPDHQLIAFARSDDYLFGVLHSRVHEVWARAQGTQVRERESGFRYTPTSCFETFPLPLPSTSQCDMIASAAKHLDELRTQWLNPPEWNKEEVLEFPGSVDGPWSRSVHEPNKKGVGTVRYARLIPKDAYVFSLAKRTLTNLYNERPTWLDLAHRELDEAVFEAYGWDPSMSDEGLLAALLALNLERAEALGRDAVVDETDESGEDVD